MKVKDVLSKISDFFLTKKTSSKTFAVNDIGSQSSPSTLKSACHAPSTSLYFGHNGKVQACCHNRNYVLGEYPALSIKDIWEGYKIIELREKLKNNDYSLGCEGCKSSLLAGNISGMAARAYDSLPLLDNFYPSEMQFELNNTCNFECIMCNGEYSSLIRANKENRAPLTNVYDNAFIAQLRDFLPYLTSVQFYGGEPFLIDEYYSIWELIAEENPLIMIRIQTNGSILNKRVKDLLKKCRFSINISLDSVSEKNYSLIRKNGKLSRVKENIEWFAAYCVEKKTNFGISICAMQQNWDELPAIINYASSLKGSVYIHDVVTPSECSLRYLNAAEISAIYYKLKASVPSMSKDSPEATKNVQIFEDYLYNLKKMSENIHMDFKGIHSDMDSFYEELKNKIVYFNLEYYNPDDIIIKLKKSLQGIENQPDILNKFNRLNLNQEFTVREMVNAIHITESAYYREMILTIM